MAHASTDAAAHAPGDHAPGSSHAHAHHIVPQRLLLLVLSLLLFFTLLTVGCTLAEQWVAHAFNVVIPQWVNVTVALSIATVKSIIVAAYFMQLRYDSPVNTMIVVFTLICFSFFIGFTMIDMGNRDALYDYKAKVIVPGGGTAGGGSLVRSTGERAPNADGIMVAKTETIQDPIVIHAQKQADIKTEGILHDAYKAKQPLSRDLLNKVLQTRFANVISDHLAKGTFDSKVTVAYKAYLAANPSVMDLAHAAHGHAHADTGSSSARARPVTDLQLPVMPHGSNAHGEHAPAVDHSTKPAPHTPADAPKH